MPLPTCPPVIDLRDRPPIHVETVRVHRAERANPAGQRPVARRQAIGDGNALAAFYQRKDITPAHPYRVDRSHGRMSQKRPAGEQSPPTGLLISERLIAIPRGRALIPLPPLTALRPVAAFRTIATPRRFGPDLLRDICPGRLIDDSHRQ